MSDNALVSIGRAKASAGDVGEKGKILLVKLPYFTPWTPPLGIAILKAFLERHGYPVKCFDFNADAELWGMHHKYFTVLQTLEDVSINDGYSKLWWILNAHMLAYANGAGAEGCARVLETVVPLYGIRYDGRVTGALLPLVEKYFRRLERLTDEFDLSEYAVVGTSTYTTSLASSLFFLRKAKRQHPGVKTVMGGGIFADDLALGSDNLTTLLEEYPFIDHVVLGEGEKLFLKLLEGELAHKRVISLADAKDSTLDMKDVPSPDFSDLSLEGYFHMTIEGARSCPFQCSFCSETIQWGEYRKKPVGLLADQVIELAARHGNNTFFMGDSLMNPYIVEFSKALLARGADILYDGYLRADKPVTHRDRVLEWARSGCYRVRLGIESAAKRVLQSMDKMTTPAVIADVLKTLANSGIRTTTYWIVGFAGETEEDFQETLDFIRENHRFIYELEAHPHYYYPYGQVGSRLHQCYPLYPQEVTDVIKFRVWDIVDGQPTREVKYERLRRISRLASELGIPNIYTMAERYKAEERWQLLHPLVREVYEGSRVRRADVRLPARPVPALPSPGGRDEAGAARALCYRTHVATRLDPATLSAAAEQLVRRTEMLQMTLDGDAYVAAAEPLQFADEMVSVYERGLRVEDGAETFRRRVVDELSARIRPARGRSLRLALIDCEEQGCELLLLVDRAVADSRGVVLLAEDLFRIYEQLSNGREVALRPLEKSYADFASNLKPAPASPPASARAARDEAGPRGESPRRGARTIPVPGALATRIFSDGLKRCGLRPAEVLVSALLRSLAAAGGGAPAEVEVTADLRATDAALSHLVAPLTLTGKLPGADAADGDALSHVRRLRQAFEDAGRSAADAARAGSSRAETDAPARTLLNLEYFTEDPWLGGDGWRGQGFVPHQLGPFGGHELEVMPVRANGSVEVRMNYEERGETPDVVAAMARVFPAELEAVVDACERYAAASSFWLDVFGKDVPPANIEAAVAGPAPAVKGWASTPFAFEKALLERIGPGRRADDPMLLLAAFGVLLSRLNGREDLSLAAVIGEREERWPVPARLQPAWNLSFGEFLRATEQKLDRSYENGLHAFDVLAGEEPGAAWKRPVFDVGYIFRKGAVESSDFAPDGDVLKNHPSVGRGLVLFLEAAESERGLDARFTYEEGRFEPEIVEQFVSYMKSILEEVAGDIDIPLGSIALDGRGKGDDAVEALSEEVFNF